jgi:hypothetical protein
MHAQATPRVRARGLLLASVPLLIAAWAMSGLERLGWEPNIHGSFAIFMLPFSLWLWIGTVACVVFVPLTAYQLCAFPLLRTRGNVVALVFGFWWLLTLAYLALFT